MLHVGNIEITKNLDYEPSFSGVYSRDNLPKIKDEAYVINLDNKNGEELIGVHYLLTEIQPCILIL